MTFQAWIRSVELYLLNNEEVYDINQKRIAFALSFVKKKSTLGWTTTFTSDAIDNKKFGTFTNFKNSLTKAFLTTDLKVKALVCLQSIAQTKDKILPYINEFKITAHLSRIVDQTVLISLFAEGLNPALMHHIYSMDSVPTTIDEWYTIAERYQVQWNWSSQVVSQWTKDHKTPPPSICPYLPSTPTGKIKDPNAMDIDAIYIRKLTPEE